MDTFILVATSFTIAVSLMIKGKKDKLQTSFACLCTIVLISQSAVFLRGYFDSAMLTQIEEIGILALAPASLYFLIF